jgi:hypothetical protein
MRTDGQTDRHDEAGSGFRNFSNAPKNKGAKINGLNITKALHHTWMFRFLNSLTQTREHETENCPHQQSVITTVRTLTPA